MDLGTIIYNKEDINYLRQIPDYINHVHISEPGLNIIVHRALHPLLFEILNSIAYKGYVSIEMGNKGALSDVKNCMVYIKQFS